MRQDTFGCYKVVNDYGLWGSTATKEYCDAPCGNSQKHCVSAIYHKLDELKELNNYWRAEIKAGHDGVGNIKIVQQQLRFYEAILEEVQTQER